jgi:dihydroorotate dehydrogenase
VETTAQIIGINNRNLATFETALDVTEKLSEQVPDEIVLVSESGIRTAEDVARVQGCGVDAVLIGEALMRGSKDLIEKLGTRDGKITGAETKSVTSSRRFRRVDFSPRPILCDRNQLAFRVRS